MKRLFLWSMLTLTLSASAGEVTKSELEKLFENTESMRERISIYVHHGRLNTEALTQADLIVAKIRRLSEAQRLLTTYCENHAKIINELRSHAEAAFETDAKNYHPMFDYLTTMAEYRSECPNTPLTSEPEK